MTSKLTREQLIERAKYSIQRYSKALKGFPESKEILAELQLAELALAAMDSEPVAWTEKCEITNMQATGLYLRGFPDNSHGRDIPLYRHAQPASVVPEVTAGDCPAFIKYDITDVDEAWSRGFNACRAAMLQAGTFANEDTRQVDELTIWIKRLVRSLKNANPDSKLPRDAMDYLTAKGLISVGDILR